MKYQTIQHPDSLEMTFIGRPIPEGSRQLYTFEAATWEEAMAEHHRRQGFKPYQPEGEATPCVRCGDPVYQEGSGDCGKCGSVEVKPFSDDAVDGLLTSARWGLAHGMHFDNYDHTTIVALCETIQHLKKTYAD